MKAEIRRPNGSRLENEEFGVWKEFPTREGTEKM
jgi:hypothetical protein